MSTQRTAAVATFLLAWVPLASLNAQDAATQPAATTTAAHEDPSQPAVKSGPRAEWFLGQHDSLLKRKSQGPVGVLFLGDSITAGWTGKGKEVWEKTYADYQPGDFGVSGDKTQNVLWRIANGEIDGLHPQLTIFMLGTNNLSTDTADDIAAADTKIIHLVQEKTGSKVLVLAVFPRDHKGDDEQTMVKVNQINQALAKLDNGDTIRYLDIGKVFLGPDGKVNKDIMNDGLHPNAQGYQLWADAMRPLFEQMAHKPTSQPATP